MVPFTQKCPEIKLTYIYREKVSGYLGLERSGGVKDYNNIEKLREEVAGVFLI